MANRYKISKAWTQDVQEVIHGRLSFADNSSYSGSATGTTNWERTRQLISESVSAGQVFTNPIISTYSLAYTTTSAYTGGVLAPNGDIHFVPYAATVGQKISAAGVVSTYSSANAYIGGVLAPNGDIHFVPYDAAVGQILVTGAAKPFGIGLCSSAFLNKF